MLLTKTTLLKYPFHPFWITVTNPPVSRNFSDRPSYDIPNLGNHSEAVLPHLARRSSYFEQEAEGSFIYEEEGTVMVFAYAVLFEPTIADLPISVM